MYKDKLSEPIMLATVWKIELYNPNDPRMSLKSCLKIFCCFFFLFLFFSFPFFFFFLPHVLWDLSSPTRNWTGAWGWSLAVSTWSPNHWTARNSPYSFLRAWCLAEFIILFNKLHLLSSLCYVSFFLNNLIIVVKYT